MSKHLNEIADPIEVLAYCECLITCEAPGCLSVYDRSLEDGAKDPMEDWAKRMAKAARQDNWTAGRDGLVLCPVHMDSFQE